jgi:hypothetical protein
MITMSGLAGNPLRPGVPGDIHYGTVTIALGSPLSCRSSVA